MKTNYKPVLFSTPMVQAIQNGTKTQTRRTKGLEIINKEPNNYRYDGISDDEHDSYRGCHFFEYIDKEGYPKETYTPEECPYAIGDILWVRETFYKPSHEEFDGKYFYKADLEQLGWDFKWKPSIFMPRAACRIFLKVTNIRAERLLSISREDAMKEGVAFQRQPHCDEYKDYTIKETEFSFSNPNHTFPDVPTLSFFTLWESINGSESLALNPWVWVIEYEKVERPNDFIV